MTLPESILTFRENLIKMTIYLIKYASLTNFIENGRGTDARIIFDIKFALLYMNGMTSLFLNSEE